jgi:diguanylate cyclase (GGDEF)-like protein
VFLNLPRFKGEKELAYQAEQFRRVEFMQRWMVLGGGALLGIAGLWVSFAVGDTGSGFATTSLTVLFATLVLWGMTYAPYLKNRLEFVPMLVAIGFGAAIVMSILFLPTGGALRFAYLFEALAVYVVMLSPTIQSSVAALVAEAMVATLGLVVIYPMQSTPISFFGALTYTLPLFALACGLAYAIERARREAFSLRTELSRRATTDTISGVSNRAHINQMAQNEFGRARRYKEPLSIMMIEVDNFDGLLNTWGPIAADTMIQVFTGYCVLVMRHCDSFGRLGPNRFMAILPETPGKGAHILSSRMCREIAKHDVVVDGEILNFTVSIGAAEVSATDRWAGDMLRRVEQALEDAIESGRGQAVMATPPRPQADTFAGEGGAPMHSATVTPLPTGQAAAAPPAAATAAAPGQAGGAPAPTPEPRRAGISGGPGMLAGQGPVAVRR